MRVYNLEGKYYHFIRLENILFSLLIYSVLVLVVHIIRFRSYAGSHKYGSIG